VTNLLGSGRAEEAGLQLATQGERLNLLAKLRSADAGEGVEADADEDGIPTKGMTVRRRKRALEDLSGADALYKEFRSGAKRSRGPSIRKLVNQRRIA
jgi:hypothetical protein